MLKEEMEQATLPELMDRFKMLWDFKVILLNEMTTIEEVSKNKFFSTTEVK